MAPDYAAGHQMMEAFRETFVAGGGEIVGEAYPPLKGTKDYGPYLTAAKAAKPDAIFTFFAGGAAIAFVKQYAQFGINKDIPLYGAGFLTSAAYVHVQGQAADGVTASLHYFPGLDTQGKQRLPDRVQELSSKARPDQNSPSPVMTPRISLLMPSRPPAATRRSSKPSFPKLNSPVRAGH